MAARSFPQDCSQTHTRLFILPRCARSQILHLTVGPYRFFFSVTLGYGSALAVHPAESIMKHLCALPNPVATHRCVTGIHSHHFPGPSQLLLTQFSFRHLSKQLRNNTIFILLSLNIKCMEALSKVETFVHHSHTTKYPPHPQWNWNSDFLSWDKQLASSDVFFHSVCELFQWCTAPTTHLFRLLSARLIFGLCCLISLFSGAKQNLWCHLRIPFTSMKLALVFKEMILICLLPFWPRSIMICLYVEFFNYPSVRAGSRTKLNRGTGWHNVMQTSYQLIFTSCGNVGPYNHSRITYCPLFACDVVMVHTCQDLDVQD